MSFNGNYAVRAELDFETNNAVVSVPVTLTVSNLISFPNSMAQIFGSRMWIYAQTIPKAAVEIDICDANTNYLGSFFPVSDTNGVISFLWNLKDANGHSLKNTAFFGEFTVTVPAPFPGWPAVRPSLRITASPPFLPIQKMPVAKLKNPVVQSPGTGSTYTNALILSFH
jgi:hypothetical protein